MNDEQLVVEVGDGEFKYLGSLISDDGYCEKEIHSRIRPNPKIGDLAKLNKTHFKSFLSTT